MNFCMSQAPVGQRSAQKPQCSHTSSSLTMTRCVFNGAESELRKRLSAPAPNLTQDLYVSSPLKTKRVMVKDEDVCLHCGMCAERCPTGAWDMQKFILQLPRAGA